MQNIRKIITMAALLTGAASNISFAQSEKLTPLETYRSAVNGAMLLCPLSVELSSMDVASENANWAKCITDSKKEVKDGYQAAAKTVKKQAAKAALKEHYVTAMAGITSTAPGLSELKINYKRRQSENIEKLVEKWERFEVEQ